MAKKLISGPILAPLAKIWVPKTFSWILPLLHVRLCCKLLLHAISSKIDMPNLREQQKAYFRNNFGSFGPDFGPKFFSQVLPLLHLRHCCKLSLYAISRKTNKANLRKWRKSFIYFLIIYLIHYLQSISLSVVITTNLHRLTENFIIQRKI